MAAQRQARGVSTSTGWKITCEDCPLIGESDVKDPRCAFGVEGVIFMTCPMLTIKGVFKILKNQDAPFSIGCSYDPRT